MLFYILFFLFQENTFIFLFLVADRVGFKAHKGNRCLG